MTHDLRPPCLEVARLELAAALVALGIPVPAIKVQEAISRRVVRAYLTEAAKTPAPRRLGRLHPDTRAMMEMAVGDVLTVPWRPSSVWSNRMSRIRVMQDNDQLRWRVEAIGTDSVITRLGDGGLVPKSMPGELTKLLATMLAGDVLTVKDFPRLNQANKAGARKILNNPHAVWTSETTNQGLRIRRRK